MTPTRAAAAEIFADCPDLVAAILADECYPTLVAIAGRYWPAIRERVMAEPDWWGEIACYASWVTAAEGMELARKSTPWWRRYIARYASWVTDELRAELMQEAR